MGMALLILIRRMHATSPDLPADLFVIATGTVGFSVAGLILMHWFLSVPYPYNRSGLYLIPTFLLALFTGTTLLIRSRTGVAAVAGTVGAGVLAVMGFLFALQLNLKYFVEWRFDASTHRLIDVIITDNKAEGGHPFSIGSSRLCEQSLKYYRSRRKLHHMSLELATQDLECAVVDYFVLVEQDRHLVDELSLQVLAEDPLSGTVVARRS
jgi:hypothetical protein